MLATFCKYRRLLSAVASDAVDETVKKVKTKGKNFYEVADKLVGGGKGLNLSRSLWRRYPEPCYWTVSRVKFSKHGHTPKAWGTLTWRGVPEERVREIRGTHKRQWRVFEAQTPQEEKPTDAARIEQEQ